MDQFRISLGDLAAPVTDSVGIVLSISKTTYLWSDETEKGFEKNLY